MDSVHKQRYFFHDGLHFQCTGCGTCCTGDPGIVAVSHREAAAIARYLGQPLADLVRDPLLPVKSGYHIREYPEGRCYFYDQGCRIYSVRPRQCRSYPFWMSNLRSRYRWKNATRQCPGIGQGPLFSCAQILEILHGELAEADDFLLSNGN